MRMQIKTSVLMLLLCLISGCKTTPNDANSSISASVNGEEVANTDDGANSEPGALAAKSQAKNEAAKINAQLGMAYLEQKNVQRAKMKLLLALSQGPDIPEPWYSMGYFLEATGDKEEAAKYYLQAVTIAPGRGDTQNNYGTFLCRQGRYNESIKHFLLAVRAQNYLEPAAAYENAGLCSMKSASYKQAASYFKQALLKDPGRNLSLLKLAEANVKLGHYKEAKSFMVQYQIVAAPTPESEKLMSEIKRKTG